MDFKKNLDHLSSSFFKLKNGDFKTRDFSPLIERVLAGVYYLAHRIQYPIPKLLFLSNEIFLREQQQINNWETLFRILLLDLASKIIMTT